MDSPRWYAVHSGTLLRPARGWTPEEAAAQAIAKLLTTNLPQGCLANYVAVADGLGPEVYLPTAEIVTGRLNFPKAALRAIHRPPEW
jgi:hypothetical protein